MECDYILRQQSFGENYKGQNKNNILASTDPNNYYIKPTNTRQKHQS